MSEYHSVIPTAEPFLFLGEKAGILLVHGFTGTPKEMRTMGEFFASKGYLVLGIRLPGHATSMDDMPHIRWQDWLGAVEDGYHLLHSTGLPVFIMGLSMGGILTLTAAARLPVAGAVAMSVPYNLPKDPRLPFVEYLAWLQPTVSKDIDDWQDRAMRQQHVDYPANPTRAIAELRDLLKEMRAALPHVTCPTLLIHSRSDGSVPLENMDLIYAGLGSTDKTRFWLEKSGHVVTRDLERDQLFEAAFAFVKRVLS